MTWAAALRWALHWARIEQRAYRVTGYRTAAGWRYQIHHRGLVAGRGRYDCTGCTFAAADIGRMVGHCAATGHPGYAFGTAILAPQLNR